MKASIPSLGMTVEARVAVLATGTDYVRILELRPNLQPGIVENSIQEELNVRKSAPATVPDWVLFRCCAAQQLPKPIRQLRSNRRCKRFMFVYICRWLLHRESCSAQSHAA